MTKLLRAALVSAVLAPCLAAAPALADSGGSTAPSGGSSQDTSQNQAAGDGGITLTAGGGALLGRTVRFTGSVAGGGEGLAIAIQRLDPVNGWVDAASAVTDADGAFSAAWKADAAGTFSVRALVQRDGTQAAAASASGSTTLTVYKPTLASTFFERRTACGLTLRPTTLGVAHKTLPCGTKVTFYYRGRTITVPVVDRGPYRRGYTWDLTEATGRKLGFDGLGRVGSLVVSPSGR